MFCLSRNTIIIIYGRRTRSSDDFPEIIIKSRAPYFKSISNFH